MSPSFERPSGGFSLKRAPTNPNRERGKNSSPAFVAHIIRGELSKVSRPWKWRRVEFSELDKGDTNSTHSAYYQFRYSFLSSNPAPSLHIAVFHPPPPHLPKMILGETFWLLPLVKYEIKKRITRESVKFWYAIYGHLCIKKREKGMKNNEKGRHSLKQILTSWNFFFEAVWVHHRRSSEN